MKKIDLIKLECKNFKGVKEFEYNFNGANYSIYGANHSGKTSIKDMYFWCLTGKDGKGNDESNFGLRPYDNYGNLIHNVTIEVSATLAIEDDGVYTLTRRKIEKVSKSRGVDEKITEATECLIDGVPKKVSEYENFIKEKITEPSKIFLLANPDSFNELHWKEQRKVLSELALDINDLQLAKDNNFNDIVKMLEEKKTLDDINDICKKEIPLLKKEVDVIPFQISSLKELDFHDVENLNVELTKEKINLLTNEISSGVLIKDTTKLDNLREKAQVLRNKRIDNFNQKIQDYKKIKNDYEFKLKDKENNIKSKEEEINSLTVVIETLNKTIDSLNDNRNNLLKEYKEIKDLSFTGDTCTYCGQKLPKDKLDEALKTFNLNKSKKLEKNIECGKINSSTLEKSKISLEEKKKKLDALKKELMFLKETEVLELKLEEPKLEEETVEELEIEAQISSIINSKDNSDKLIEEKQKSITELNKVLTRYEIYTNTQEKISELEVQLSNTRNELIELETLKENVSNYISIKCKLIEDSINKYFTTIQFKLFDTQKNGNIVETCEALYHGVPFRNLSTSEKINVGIDCINSLKKIYNIEMPIFIDNAEGITERVYTGSQVIGLYVNDNKDKKLIFKEEE